VSPNTKIETVFPTRGAGCLTPWEAAELVGLTFVRRRAVYRGRHFSSDLCRLNQLIRDLAYGAAVRSARGGG
jgi:hypothetical protein